MNPFTEFLSYYEERGVSHLIWPMIEFCADHGVAYFSPEAVILARPARKDWTLEQSLHLDNAAALTLNPDAWHIFYAAGDLTVMERIAPYRLPWLTFQRNGGRLRIYSFDRLTHGIHTIRPQAPAAQADSLRHR